MSNASSYADYLADWERLLLAVNNNEEGLPDLPGYVLPGNNYHVFDYALFWSNIRADAAARLAAFTQRSSS